MTAPILYSFVVHVGDDHANFTERFLKTTGAITHRRTGVGITAIRAEWTVHPDTGGEVPRSLVSLTRTLLLLSLQTLKATVNAEGVEDITE